VFDVCLVISNLSINSLFSKIVAGSASAKV
jgi:hypothetical protein